MSMPATVTTTSSDAVAVIPETGEGGESVEVACCPQPTAQVSRSPVVQDQAVGIQFFM